MLSGKDKALLMKLFYKNKESATVALRKFRLQKNAKTGQGPLTMTGLTKLVQQFEEIGSLEDRVRSIHFFFFFKTPKFSPSFLFLSPLMFLFLQVQYASVYHRKQMEDFLMGGTSSILLYHYSLSIKSLFQIFNFHLFVDRKTSFSSMR